MPSPLPHLFSWPFVYQPSRTQVWTFPHGILLITHAHHQPVVPAEHKGTRNLHMPPGASETYIETLRFCMQYLWIPWALLSAGGRIWSRAAVWSCRGRCSVWTRSFQAVKSCVAKWKGSTWFNMVQHGSTWFNMVQRHFTPSSLPQFLSLSVTESQCIGGGWCGKWSEWSNETLRFHNLAHRILLSVCAHCRALLSQWRERQWVWTMSCHES